MSKVRTMTVQGVYLRFFMHANARHDGKLLYEWILEQARKHKLGGGSVFRAVAGFGRHGILHEEHFLELAGDLPLKLEFLLRESEADTLLEIVAKSGAELVYARSASEIGVIGAEQPD
ncbi:MAG: DUF190 domain-containing protein [Rhodanobacteraceae bacterium]